MSESATETTGTETEGTETETPTGTETTETTETEGADPRVTRANREAAKYRTERNTLQQQLQDAQSQQQTVLDNIAKALGLKADEGADPAQQVTALTGQVEQLTTRTRELEAELAVHTLAGEAGANPNKLLDSRSFANTLHALDAAAEDYTDQVSAAIKAAVEKDATLSAAGQGPSRGGAEGAGQGSAQPAGAVTQEQFDAMSYADKTQLFQTNPDLYRRLAG
jgi:hypothetical protein